eukprot:scaffold42200_cov60-Phaeocystis_antarctica.AAC.3
MRNEVEVRALVLPVEIEGDDQAFRNERIVRLEHGQREEVGHSHGVQRIQVLLRIHLEPIDRNR